MLKNTVCFTVNEMRRLLDTKQASALELLESCLDIVKRKEPNIHAFLTVTEENARQTAQAYAPKTGDVLDGIPMALKDNICTKDVKTTCASRLLRDFVPCYDAHVVSLLKQKQAVLVGKLNMDEFAMGSTNEHSAFGCTHNPLDETRVPGGSGGGCAAAVASGMIPYCLGSDTGGSIRQPAAYCGVVGMKPTYGAVSRYGLVAFASSFDQIGPITRTVYDNALVFSQIAGADDKDATCRGEQVSLAIEKLSTPPDNFRVALPKFLLDGSCMQQEVKTALDKTVRLLESNGVNVETVTFDRFEEMLPAYYILTSAEASSNLARFDGVRFGSRQEADTLEDMYVNTRSCGFGDEVKRRILLGNYALSAGYYDAYYKKAELARQHVITSFEHMFKTYDAVLMPTSPGIAPILGSTQSPTDMYQADLFTVPANLAGLPALSLPVKNKNSLPVGIQLMTAPFQEQKLYQLSLFLETLLKEDASCPQ